MVLLGLLDQGPSAILTAISVIMVSCLVVANNETSFYNATTDPYNGTTLGNTTTAANASPTRVNTTTTTTTSPNAGGSSDPTETVTATLVVIGSSPYSTVRYNTSTDVYTGNVRALRLTVNFTEKPDPEDRTVQLVIGSGIKTFALSKILKKRTGPTLEIKEYFIYRASRITYIDQVDYKVNVVRDGASSDDITHGGEFYFIVEYEIVCVAHGELSTGSAIDTEALIQIGDNSVRVVEKFVFRGEPEAGKFDITLDKRDTVELLKLLELQLIVTLACPVADLEVTADAYRELNGTKPTGGLMIQTLHVNNVGDAYQYVMRPLHLQEVGNDTCPPRPSLALTAGPWIKRDQPVLVDVDIEEGVIDDHYDFQMISHLISKGEDDDIDHTQKTAGVDHLLALLEPLATGSLVGLSFNNCQIQGQELWKLRILYLRVARAAFFSCSTIRDRTYSVRGEELLEQYYTIVLVVTDPALVDPDVIFTVSMFTDSLQRGGETGENRASINMSVVLVVTYPALVDTEVIFTVSMFTDSLQRGGESEENRASINMSVVLVVTDPSLVDTEVIFTVLVKQLESPTCQLDKKRRKLPLTVLAQNKTTKDGLELVTSKEEHISTGVKRYVILNLMTSVARNVTYDIHIDTRPDKSYHAGALKMIEVSPGDSYGVNILCPTLSLVDQNTDAKANDTEMSYTVSVDACNIGGVADPAANVFTLKVFVLLTGGATAGEQYHLEARLHNDTVNVTFVTAAQQEIAFWLGRALYSYTFRGYPIFVLITIDTPPGSSDQYNLVVRTNGLSNTFFDMAILTVNAVKVGSNLQGVSQTSGLTVNLETFLNNSVTGTASVTFWLTNTASVDDPGANEMKLEVVVMTPEQLASPDDYYTIEAELNDLHSDRIQLYVLNAPSIRNWYEPLFAENVRLFTRCNSKAFFPGMFADFTLEITTGRYKTAGPLLIVVEPNPRYRFDKASVDFRGINVACVKSGSIQPREDHGFDGATYLDIPMLCNRELSLESSDDILKVKIEVQLNEINPPVTHKEEDVLRVNASSNNQLIGAYEQAFNVATLTDLGSLQVVKGITVSDADLRPDSTDHGFNVLWGGDDGNIHCLYTLASRSGINYQTISPSRPIVARYIAVTIYYLGAFGCSVGTDHVDASEIDVPIVRGPPSRVQMMSKNIGRLFRWGVGQDPRCPTLRDNHTFRRMQYIWADIRLSMFDLEPLQLFNVKLHGHGIQCASRTGRQITMVAYPRSGEGDQHRLCELQHEQTNFVSYQVCQFLCNCTEQVECSQFTLLAMQTRSEGNFSLSYLDVSNVQPF